MILLVLRFGPKFYLQEDSDSVEDDGGGDEGGMTESEHDIVTQRWLEAQEGSDNMLAKEETLSERSEHRHASVSFVQPSFPEFLTGEDRKSSAHTMGSLSRSVTDSVVTQSAERRRRRHSQYEPPTFHS